LPAWLRDAIMKQETDKAKEKRKQLSDTSETKKAKMPSYTKFDGDSDAQSTESETEVRVVVGGEKECGPRKQHTIPPCGARAFFLDENPARLRPCCADIRPQLDPTTHNEGFTCRSRSAQLCGVHAVGCDTEARCLLALWSAPRAGYSVRERL